MDYLIKLKSMPPKCRWLSLSFWLLLQIGAAAAVIVALNALPYERVADDSLDLFPRIDYWQAMAAEMRRNWASWLLSALLMAQFVLILITVMDLHKSPKVRFWSGRLAFWWCMAMLCAPTATLAVGAALAIIDVNPVVLAGALSWLIIPVVFWSNRWWKAKAASDSQTATQVEANH